MSRIIFKCVPYEKDKVTLALESGVDALIVPAENVGDVSGLARCQVHAAEDIHTVRLESKNDETSVLERLKVGEKLIIADGWEVIPIENLLAQSGNVWVEASSLEQANLASGILERGVDGIVAGPDTISGIKAIVAQCKLAQEHEDLVNCRVTRIEAVGLGHRVCADTLSILEKGQGMLVGNSSAFTFLVHAETEHNEYVASRPFRVNAGAVHAYVRLPHDRTTYLGELKAGQEVLIVDASGDTRVATLGRVKIEVRPMLLIEAEVIDEEDGKPKKGAVFLQNAETIRLTSPSGQPVSVVALKPGDEVLCRVDGIGQGRHFGMRICEDIREV